MRTRRTLAPLALLAALLLSGCGGKSTPPYHPAPRPALPAGILAPSCGTKAPPVPRSITHSARPSGHEMGECLPAPPGAKKARRDLVRRLASHTLGLPVPGGTIRCVDLSNNDPVYGVGAWRTIKANGWPCAFFKLSEGTGFVDDTAAAMVRDARTAGLFVGGYGFQHVCWDNAASEAQLFSARARAVGLAGPNGEVLRDTLPPIADDEYGGTGCDARGWQNAWRAAVGAALHRAVAEYTGAWFHDPVYGCWWPGGASWISGYVSGGPPLPCGLSHLELWQYADNGWNGVSAADASVWRQSPAAFGAFANAGPPPDPYGIFSRTDYRFGKYRFNEYHAAKTHDLLRCRLPLRRDVCWRLDGELRALQGRVQFVAWNYFACSKVRGREVCGWRRRRAADYQHFHRGERNRLLGRRRENRNPTYLSP